MGLKSGKWIIVFFLSLLASCSSGSNKAVRRLSSVDSQKVLLVSDIHFDPFYDPALVQKLKNAKDGSEWQPIFEGSARTALSPPGRDTNYPLFKSALLAMQGNVSDPSIILIGGDFLRHELNLATRVFGDLNQKASVPNHKVDPVVLDFAVKTVQFIAGSFRKAFPNAQIIPAPGNTDSACGDYRIGPNEQLLSAMAKAFMPPSGASDFLSQFSGMGHFSAPLSQFQNLQIIVANDVFFSSGYANGCGDPGATPAQDEMGWLSNELSQSKTAGLKVWLIGHIPPGVEVSAISFGKTVSCLRKKFPLMMSAWNSGLLGLLDSDGSAVKLGIVGHTHLNEMRLYESKTGAPIPILGVPSISPIHGNNPAFQVMTANVQTADIEDVVTYSIDLSGSGGKNLDWKQSSDFQKDYAADDLTGQSFSKIAAQIQGDPALLRAYLWRMNSGASSPSMAMEKNANAYACGISNLEPSSFQSCYCK